MRIIVFTADLIHVIIIIMTSRRETCVQYIPRNNIDTYIYLYIYIPDSLLFLCSNLVIMNRCQWSNLEEYGCMVTQRLIRYLQQKRIQQLVCIFNGIHYIPGMSTTSYCSRWSRRATKFTWHAMILKDVARISKMRAFPPRESLQKCWEIQINIIYLNVCISNLTYLIHASPKWISVHALISRHNTCHYKKHIIFS